MLTDFCHVTTFTFILLTRVPQVMFIYIYSLKLWHIIQKYMSKNVSDTLITFVVKSAFGKAEFMKYRLNISVTAKDNSCF